MSILNERIKERRLDLGLTLLDVAEQLGVKEATMQRYESGQIKNIKHETIVALADIFKCTPAYLMGWDEKSEYFTSQASHVMNNIAKIRKSAGLSQASFGKLFGVAQNTVCNWEIGKREPDVTTLKRMSKQFGVSIDYILNQEYASEIESDAAPISTGRKAVAINVYGTIRAGIPTESIESIVDTEEIPASWMSGGREYFALRVKGDNMYPDYLDGDTVIIRRQTTCITGDDCVVYINGNDATLKRVKLFEDGSLELLPLNPNYPPHTFSRKDVSEIPVTIGGVVVELRRSLQK